MEKAKPKPEAGAKPTKPAVHPQTKGPPLPLTKNTKPGHSSDQVDVGITVKKDQDMSEWYSQVIIKADLIDYTSVSGCYIFKPNAYGIWEHIQSFFDGEIKKLGVRNAYFPLFIPESLFVKEADHVAGFTPEVAWVTQGGNTPLAEKLAVRPTSETIICDAFSRWVRSWRDLPIRVNQWCNVVRWEFKHPTPFLRSREFLWQEGHTVHATKESAEEEVHAILELYRQVFEDILAVPVMLGRKSDTEKFAGADYTLSVEAFMPNGKAVQSATSHYLGHHFAQAFDIGFLDEKGARSLVHSNSWGISTRSIGAMILTHGDDKGLVIPPKAAPVKVVIVPILFDDTKEKVLEACHGLKKTLGEKFVVELDDRDGYTAGYKYNHWELRGVPVRIEVGPKDLLKGSCMMARRDTGAKEAVPLEAVTYKLGALLEDIQKNLLSRAREAVKANTVTATTFTDVKKAINERKLVLAPWCTGVGCEERVKNECDGAKTLNIPLDQPREKPGTCAMCPKPGTTWVYLGKSY